jgi:hypothetical protein
MDTEQPVPDMGPQKWERAAENVSIADLDDELRGWLQESRMPGTDAIKSTSWALSKRVKFLKLLCGEET